MTRLSFLLAPEGSAMRTYCRNYYREVVYFMHQPQSMNVVTLRVTLMSVVSLLLLLQGDSQHQ